MEGLQKERGRRYFVRFFRFALSGESVLRFSTGVNTITVRARARNCFRTIPQWVERVVEVMNLILPVYQRKSSIEIFWSTQRMHTHTGCGGWRWISIEIWISLNEDLHESLKVKAAWGSNLWVDFRRVRELLSFIFILLTCRECAYIRNSKFIQSLHQISSLVFSSTLFFHPFEMFSLNLQQAMARELGDDVTQFLPDWIM